jgi:hypothetical protein
VGRLAVLVGGVVLATTVGAVLAARLLGLPDAAGLPVPDPGAGLRAQHGLAELLLRAGGVSNRRGPVEMTTAELDAFLSRHLEARRLRLYPLRVHAESEALEIAGRTTVGHLVPGTALGWLPGGVLDLGIWVSATGRVEVRPGGEAEFVVDRTAVGRQRVPPGWLWRLLGVDTREFTWQMPRVVERIEIQPGRLLIHTRPRRG